MKPAIRGAKNPPSEKLVRNSEGEGLDPRRLHPLRVPIETEERSRTALRSAQPGLMGTDLAGRGRAAAEIGA
jgi:hypothetical protein